MGRRLDEAAGEDDVRRVSLRHALVTTVDRDGARLAPAQQGLPGAVGQVLAAMTHLALTGAWPRVKACRNPTCHLAFVDRSRNTSGAYCGSTCSSQVAMRAYRRRRADPPLLTRSDVRSAFERAARASDLGDRVGDLVNGGGKAAGDGSRIPRPAWPPFDDCSRNGAFYTLHPVRRLTTRGDQLQKRRGAGPTGPPPDFATGTAGSAAGRPFA